MKTTEIKEQVVSGKYDALIEDLYADPSLLTIKNNVMSLH